MGKLIGIARREKSRDPMEILREATISADRGLDGDCKGARFPQRQLTIMAIEDWQAALALIGSPKLDWTVRRANLLVKGMNLPRGKGSQIQIGEVIVEVTGQTSPCQKMEYAQPGLLKALSGNWRGGVTTKVIQSGLIQLGDDVSIRLEVPEFKIRLTG